MYVVFRRNSYSIILSGQSYHNQVKVVVSEQHIKKQTGKQKKQITWIISFCTIRSTLSMNSCRFRRHSHQLYLIHFNKTLVCLESLVSKCTSGSEMVLNSTI